MQLFRELNRTRSDDLKGKCLCFISINIMNYVAKHIKEIKWVSKMIPVAHRTQEMQIQSCLNSPLFEQCE